MSADRNERLDALASAARDLLRMEQPDWAELAELAARALALVDEGRARELAVPPETARAARDELWAWALTSAPGADEARVVALRVDGLLDDAARLEREGDAAAAAAAYGRVVALVEPAIEVASTSRSRN